MKKVVILDCTIIAALQNVLGAYFGLRNLYLRIFDGFCLQGTTSKRSLRDSCFVSRSRYRFEFVSRILDIGQIFTPSEQTFCEIKFKIQFELETADQFRSSCNAVQLNDKFCHFENLDYRFPK